MLQLRKKLRQRYFFDAIQQT